MSRIHVAYAKGLLHPKTSMFAHRVGAEMHMFESWDDFAYWRLLAGLWEKGETFLIVEEDVVPTSGVTRRILGCTSSWCGAPTMYGDAPFIALGCTKFDSDLLRAEPDVLAEPLRWNQIDGQISKVLRERGYQPHEHWPPARHYNPAYR